MRRSDLRGVRPTARALLGAFFMLTAACGQKPGVHLSGAPPAVRGGDLSAVSVVTDPVTGEQVVVPGGTAFAASDPGDGTSSVQLSDPDAGTTSDGTSAGPPRPSRERPPVGGSTIGVKDDTIKIGIHVPLTGTAPLPPTAVRALEHYWDHLCAKGKYIAGRCVEVVFKDDNSEVTTARSQCKEMIERHRVFMLMGLAGTHLIHACARQAEKAGVPYIAGGTVVEAFEELTTHFAITMPHPRQAHLAADVMTERYGARTEKNAMLRTKIALTIETERALKDALGDRGAELDLVYLVDPSYRDRAISDISSAVVTMKSHGIQNVYFSAGPMHFVQFVREASAQDFYPQIIAPGPAIALDYFIDEACGADNAAHGTYALNPYPAFIDRDRFDRDFAKAAGVDEFEWWMWGHMKIVAALLEQPGRELTRERFLWYTARAEVDTGIYPRVRFSPADHFGGESMHLLRADCKRVKPAWVTDEAFFRGSRP